MSNVQDFDEDLNDSDEQLEGNFLKLNAYYVASSLEKVNGVLLVTPTSIMFDPNPKDAYVLQNGVSKYGVMCSLCYAAGITVFSYSTLNIGLCDASKEPCSANEEGAFHFKLSSTDEKLSSAFPWIHSIVTSIEEVIPSSEEEVIPSDVFLRVVSKIPIKKTFAPGDFQGIKKDTMWFGISTKCSKPLLSFFLRWQRESNDYDSPLTQFTESFRLQTSYESLKSNELFPMSPSRKSKDKVRHDVVVKPEWQVCCNEEVKDVDVGEDFFEIEPSEEPESFQANLLPELMCKSALLCEEFLQEVSHHLPGRCVSNAWDLHYSSFEHGISLRTLYRKLESKLDDSPVVLVAQDDEGYVFGAFCPCTLHISEHFYGNGESFLFSSYPQVKFYKWTGDNTFFIKGDVDSISFGGGDGTGLWLDGDLKQGSSQPCRTFRNEMLSSKNPFNIQGVEVWGFV